MTSLLPRPRPARRRASSQRDPRHRRPLVLLATLGGVGRGRRTLLVCLGARRSSAGSSPTPAPTAHPATGCASGALGWLMAHGSGVRVEGVRSPPCRSASPWLCAWSIWRIGHRVGDAISGHGPDADRIADGERDWTVPIAAALFTAGVRRRRGRHR